MSSISSPAMFVWSTLLLLAASGAHAEIVKCRNSGGQITYTQNSCPAGTSPVDLPDGVASDPVGSFAKESSEPELSPRARAMELDPPQMERARQFCADGTQANHPDCAALREIGNQTQSFIESLDRRQRKAAGEECRAGDQQACEMLYCPPDLGLNSTSDRVRACARWRKLPVTRDWAQVRQQGQGRTFEADFLCFTQATIQNAYAMSARFFQNVEVRPHTIEGERIQSYRHSAGRGSFPTVADAATAGCAARAAAAGQVAR
jgi:hypothetical protein